MCLPLPEYELISPVFISLVWSNLFIKDDFPTPEEPRKQYVRLLFMRSRSSLSPASVAVLVGMISAAGNLFRISANIPANSSPERRSVLLSTIAGFTPPLSAMAKYLSRRFKL